MEAERSSLTGFLSLDSLSFFDYVADPGTEPEMQKCQLNICG